MPVKKVIRFNDLDGNPVEKVYYFSLGQTDVIEMDMIHDQEDVPAYLKSIVENKDSRELLRVWKELLFRAVAERVGNRLDKSQEVIDEFKGSGAYEQFFSELVSSEDAGASFFVSIMPADAQEKAAAEQNREYTEEELLSMSDEQFDKIAGTDTKKMSKEHFHIAFQRRNRTAV